MSEQIGSLLLHEDAAFDDQVIYATGHAYVRCAFNRCTFIFRGAPFHISNCKIIGCVWHIDVLLHDKPSANALIKLVNETILAAVPAPDDAADPAGSSPDGKG